MNYGFSVPTGSIDETMPDMDGHHVYPYDMQLGLGVPAFITTATYLGQRRGPPLGLGGPGLRHDSRRAQLPRVCLGQLVPGQRMDLLQLHRRALPQLQRFGLLPRWDPWSEPGQPAFPPKRSLRRHARYRGLLDGRRMGRSRLGVNVRMPGCAADGSKKIATSPASALDGNFLTAQIVVPCYQSWNGIQYGMGWMSTVSWQWWY
ncbi:hypothetical protein [Verrucomicrobium sp. 3C]|uniref:hypothetical protein n=1 Tax=Verrucomicrobium sp. 3C TaxID=1134055 RepID=UPI0018CAF7D0|nr:hypothetical protein [Verrucomicrobium sp. 3C]